MRCGQLGGSFRVVYVTCSAIVGEPNLLTKDCLNLTSEEVGGIAYVQDGGILKPSFERTRPSWVVVPPRFFCWNVRFRLDYKKLIAYLEIRPDCDGFIDTGGLYHAL